MEPSMAAPQVRLVSVRALRRNRRNARTHSKKQIGQIADSIRQFGWTCPIIADEDGLILAGHGRYDAALQLGLREVPAIFLTGLTDAQKRAYALADNKISANAGWDRAVLAAELAELAALLPECNLDIEITGFAPAEVDTLLGELVDGESNPADEIPDLRGQPAVARPGDLFVMGRHRLLVGDARREDSFATLMVGQRAEMAFLDPPYNVRIQGHVGGRGRIKHREFACASGEMSAEQFTAFLEATLGLCARHSVDGAIHFICMDWRHVGELLAAGGKVYSELKNLCVWAKSNAGQGSFYRSQHELIFVFKNGDGPHLNNFELGQHGRTRSNVWQYAGVNTFRAGRMDELTMHPTVKPVALVADAMKDCSRRGGIVLDVFSGSGTTIMAAE
jgi:hypothetical protein